MGVLAIKLHPNFKSLVGLTLPYANYTLTDDFKFSFNFADGPNGREIVFLVTTTYEGYASIGFGSRMQNADIITI